MLKNFAADAGIASRLFPVALGPARLRWSFGDATSFMKPPLTLIALVLITASCATSTSDTRLAQKLVGTWTPDSDNRRTIEVRADGTYVAQLKLNLTNSLTAEGTWQVKNGCVVATLKSASPAWPDATFEPVSNRVASVDDQKLVFAGRPGSTNTITLHRN